MKNQICFFLKEEDIAMKGDNQAFFTSSRMFGHELAHIILEIGGNLKKLKVVNSVIAIPYVYCITNFKF